MSTSARLCVWSVWIALVSGCGANLAQPYPSRPIRMIIPAGAGGGVDTVARSLGSLLSSALGQAIVMDNRPGAGTMLASEITAKAPPDGYTLLMVTNSHAINAGVHKGLRYDPIRDFSYVSAVASVPYWIVVHPSVPARSVKELIVLARRRAGELHFSSAGNGSGTHLAFELFQSMAQIELVHVPYKGGSAAMVDLVGGHVQVMASNTINSRPHVVAKRLIALALTAAHRSPLYPQLPTVAESGLPGYQADAWYGVIGPAKVPEDIVARLHREIGSMLKSAEMSKKLAAEGADVIGNTPEQFTQLMKNEIAKWAKVTAHLKLRID